MSQFNEAFLFDARDAADLEERVVRTTAFSRTSIVPVDGLDGAVAAARDLLAREGLDLIELYGGFGPRAAAAVWEATDGAVPVGAIGVEDAHPERDRVAIFEAADVDPDGDRWEFAHGGRRVLFRAAPDAAAVARLAAEEVAAGAARVELCGGLGVVPTAAALASVGGRAEVAAIAFGFESLPGAAAYRARFEAAYAAAGG